MMNAGLQSRKQGWLAALLLIPALVAAAVVGFFVFAVLLGVALMVTAMLMLRVWWRRRNARSAGSGTSQILEGECVVVPEEVHQDRQSRH